MGVRKPTEVSEKALLDLLGLAARSGNLVAGTDLVRRAVRHGKIAVVLLAADASPTQREKLVPLLDARQIGYQVVLRREQLGGALGRGPISAVGVTNESFARRVAELAAALQD
ncbi:MAG TPA: ribosomal L7Ae/L30e/S12e/Gadd45 family protein [Longimicrobiaceae bacterium]|nr:ribosomal L7Ae/L30e/S12e/Gadd45 family protein [Longimicrobiaceae bacterium]